MTENEEMGLKEVKNSQKKKLRFVSFVIFDFFSFEIYLITNVFQT